MEFECVWQCVYKEEKGSLQELMELKNPLPTVQMSFWSNWKRNWLKNMQLSYFKRGNYGPLSLDWMQRLLETEILHIFTYPLLFVDTGIKLEVLKIEKGSGCLRKIKSGNTYTEGFMIFIPRIWKSLVSILLFLASLVAFSQKRSKKGLEGRYWRRILGLDCGP